MNQWVIPAIGSFLLWGLWSFLPKIITRYISPQSMVFYEVIGGIIFTIIMLSAFNFRPDPHLRGAILSVVAGIIGFAGSLCFFYAVSYGPISLISVFSALYPIIAILLATLFLGETLTLKQIIGIVFGLISITLIVS